MWYFDIVRLMVSSISMKKSYFKYVVSNKFEMGDPPNLLFSVSNKPQSEFEGRLHD